MFFEVIDPCSLNHQGEDIGVKYRAGVYSRHLVLASDYIQNQANYEQIVVETCPPTQLCCKCTRTSK
ncbi:peptide-methionine (S)-S-oxide reductase [Loigolactobacillus coryniformis]|uniref:peptide-methionine (S)-S-oxide reductase n=1 Tax=Loigolactobacillus coryniformis TaxID=1610 RepID=UPI003CC81C82